MRGTSVGIYSTTNIPSYPLYSPKFDGTYYLENTSPTGLPVGNSEKSIFGWVKITAPINPQVLFGYGGTSDNYHQTEFIYNDSYRELTFWWNQPFSTIDYYGNNSNILAPNTWYFIGMTYHSNSIFFHIYVNGRSSHLGVGTGGIDSASDKIRFGLGLNHFSAFANLFVGNIENVGVWDRALSTDEIDTYYAAGRVPYSGLPSELTTTTSTETANSQARSLNLGNFQARKIEIDDLQATGLPITPVYQAASFNGGNQIVINSAPTNVVTISVWAKYDNISSNGPIIIKGNNAWNSNQWDWGIWADNSNFYATSWASPSFASCSHNNTSWYHIVLVRDNGSETACLYVNGNLIGTGSGSNGNNFANTMYIGGIGGQYMHGAVEEIQLFDYPLLPSEIVNIYNSGKGIYGSINDVSLIAGYHLNNDLIDYSTNGNHGSWNGAPAFEAGGITATGFQAADFNGSNRIAISESTNIVAVSVWVNFSSSSSFSPVIVKGDDTWASTSWDWGIFADSSNFYAVAEPAGGPFCTVGHALNTWYHLVLVRNDGSNNCAMYVNGVLISSGTASDSNAFGNNVFIGGVSGANMIGQIQEVQLFNSYPSPEFITKLYNSGMGVYGCSIQPLISGYHLNGNTTDYSANANNATWTGTSAYTTGIIRNGYKAASFDGSSNIITPMAPTNVNSISIWVNSDGSQNYGAIITKGNNAWDYNQWDWGIWHDGGSTFYVAGPIGLIASYHYNYGSWYHLVVVQNDGLGASHFYVNGNLIGSGTAATANKYDNKIYIGGTSNLFVGQIEEIQLFNRGLSSDEVISLYNNGNGVYGTCVSGLVGGYHLNGDAIDYVNLNNGVWNGTEKYASGIISSNTGSSINTIETSGGYTLQALKELSVDNVETSTGLILQFSTPTIADIVTANGDYLQFGKSTSVNNGVVSFWNLSENSGTRYDSVGSNHLNQINTVLDFSYTNHVGRGNPTTFTDATSPAASSWLWDFGDNTATSTDQNPTHTYEWIGTFTVTLTINGSHSVSHNIVVEEPIPSFTDNSPVYRGLTMTFADTSTGAVSWFWDFGDGNTSTEQNPTHTYAAAGTYTVTLAINE